MIFHRAVLTVTALMLTGIIVGGALASSGKIPVTTSSAEAREQFLKGRELVDNLRLTDAAPYFAAAVAADPEFALGYLYVGITASTAKEFMTAVGRADDLAKHASKGEQLWIKGVQAGAFGDPKGQRQAYDALVKAYPEDERAYMILGSSMFAALDYVPASVYLQKSVDLNPQFAPAYNQLGYAYMFLGKKVEAEKAFKRYTELLPHDPNPFDSYAEFLLREGRFDESIIQYRKALSVDAHFVPSEVGIVTDLIYQTKHDAARREAEKLLAMARNDGERRTAHFVASISYADEGQTEKAIEELNKEYAIAEGTADVISMSQDNMAMGGVFAAGGKHAEARSAYAKALEILEGSAVDGGVKEFNRLNYHFNMATVLAAADDLEGAKKESELFRAAAEKQGGSLQLKRIHELAGIIALTDRNYAVALSELKQANQIDPLVLYRLAIASRETGNLVEARRYSAAAARLYALPTFNFAFARMKAEKLLATLAANTGSGTR